MEFHFDIIFFLLSLFVVILMYSVLYRISDLLWWLNYTFRVTALVTTVTNGLTHCCHCARVIVMLHKNERNHQARIHWRCVCVCVCVIAFRNLITFRSRIFAVIICTGRAIILKTEAMLFYKINYVRQIQESQIESQLSAINHINGFVSYFMSFS